MFVIKEAVEMLKTLIGNSTDLYPLIREQWVWLSSIRAITIFVSIILGVSLAATIGSIIFGMDEYTIEVRNKYFNLAKKCAIVCLACAVAVTLLFVLKLIVAPDLSLIMELTSK